MYSQHSTILTKALPEGESSVADYRFVNDTRKSEVDLAEQGKAKNREARYASLRVQHSCRLSRKSARARELEWMPKSPVATSQAIRSSACNLMDIRSAQDPSLLSPDPQFPLAFAFHFARPCVLIAPNWRFVGPSRSSISID